LNSSQVKLNSGLDQSGPIYKLYSTLFLYFILAVIFLSPIFRGFFFPREWYILHYATIVFFILWLIFLILVKTKPFQSVPLDYAALAFALCYLLSTIAAASPLLAWQEFFKVLNVLILYIFVRTLLSTNQKADIYYLILDTFLFAGLMVSLIGLAGASGIFTMGSLLDNENMRINSTFQYHNAAATYLSAVFLIALGMLSLQKGWQAKLYYTLVGFLSLLTILLTFSRGAWLALAISIFIFFIFCIPELRLRSIVNSILLLSVAFLGVTVIARHFVDKTGYGIIIPLVFMVVLVWICTVLLDLLFKRFRLPNYISIILLMLAVFLFFIAPNHGSTNTFLPDFADSGHLQESTAPELAAPKGSNPVNQRITEISLQTFSAQERFIYYRTALKIARDYPLTGAGGGAWEVLYLSYLTEEHPDFVYTREAHSHYLKVLIEAGILGLVAFVAIWIFFIAGFLKYRFSKTIDSANKQLFLTIFAPAIMIGLHSMIELSLSFGAIAIFLWILLAMGSTIISEKGKMIIMSK